MKKKLLAIFLCVALVASLAVGLAACNKDKNTTAKASNAETLGTAIAMVANTAAGTGASAAEGEQKEGINISISDDASLAVNGALTAVKPALEAALKNTVESVECFVNENGVKVETLAKDNAEFVKDSDYTLKVSVSYTNDKEEAVTDVYYIAIDTNGADIEGTANFDFSISVFVNDAEGNQVQVGTAITGSATYSNDISGLKFGFKASIAGLTEANVSAYATKEGTIGIDVSAGAGALGVGVNASVNVELGKLADNKYGANVTVNAEVAMSELGTVKATVNVSVIAEKTETSHDFAINGTVEVKYIPTVGDDNYVVKANVTGNASTTLTINWSYPSAATRR